MLKGGLFSLGPTVAAPDLICSVNLLVFGCNALSLIVFFSLMK